jgi:hypothetical protein
LEIEADPENFLVSSMLRTRITTQTFLDIKLIPIKAGEITLPKILIKSKADSGSEHQTTYKLTPHPTVMILDQK